MDPLPVEDLRSNLAKWSVPTTSLPATAERMLTLLPKETFDPDFEGQDHCTTYLDSATFALRKARCKGAKYVTVRLRRYGPSGSFALSAKTEKQKFRVEVEPAIAQIILAKGMPYPDAYGLLPANIQARILEITGDALVPVVSVSYTRYAVEDGKNRLTLDTGVRADNGKRLSCAVLEQKSNNAATPFPDFAALGLRPLKLSKFLWSTSH